MCLDKTLNNGPVLDSHKRGHCPDYIFGIKLLASFIEMNALSGEVFVV